VPSSLGPINFFDSQIRTTKQRLGLKSALGHTRESISISFGGFSNNRGVIKYLDCRRRWLNWRMSRTAHSHRDTAPARAEPFKAICSMLVWRGLGLRDFWRRMGGISPSRLWCMNLRSSICIAACRWRKARLNLDFNPDSNRPSGASASSSPRVAGGIRATRSNSA
jgi:hypothetical protein